MGALRVNHFGIADLAVLTYCLLLTITFMLYHFKRLQDRTRSVASRAALGGAILVTTGLMVDALWYPSTANASIEPLKPSIESNTIVRKEIPSSIISPEQLAHLILNEPPSHKDNDGLKFDPTAPLSLANSQTVKTHILPINGKTITTSFTAEPIAKAAFEKSTATVVFNSKSAIESPFGSLSKNQGFIACSSQRATRLYEPLRFRSINWNSKRLSRYDHFFKKYTQMYFDKGTDWRWFKVQAYVESNFKPTVRSSAGAMGLMQILPSTFREIQKMNPYFAGRSITDPETNIAAGIYYNKYLLNNWKKKASKHKLMQLMFASYNAGFSRVSSSIPKGYLKEAHLLRRTQKLPSETKGYLHKMAHFMRDYRGSSFLSPQPRCSQQAQFNPFMVVALK